MSKVAAKKSVPTRDSIPDSDKWDLGYLFVSDQAWVDAFNAYQKEFPKIANYKGKLGRSAEDLNACLEFDKSLDLQIEHLSHYASLRLTEDSSNNDHLARYAQLEHTLTQAAEIGSFITPEIQSIDDPTFDKFLASSVLKPWINRLKKLRRFKPHTLSEKEERLLALGSSALDGADTTFSQLTNVDMKFGFIHDEKGVEVELSHATFSSFLQKKNPELRKNAFHQYYKEFDDHKFTIASTLANSIKTDVFRAKARNHPSAREAALFPDNVPVSVYDNLIATIRKHLPTLYKYYDFRKRYLKLPEIHQYDTYVPLIQSIDRRTTFDEAIGLVIESLAPLGDQYTTTLLNGLSKERWCDRYETKGKRSGAFSHSSYGKPPYIMMNYKEDVFSDVYTLAHEAGHSMHSWYCMREQTYQDHHYPIFLAEVASTFNEELLTHHLLQKTDDRLMRAYIINRQIDDIRGTIFRQTMFAEFEKVAHEMEEAGEGLTLESFRAAYRKLLDAYFGENFVIDTELELECLRIPHFYSAFYVYKYATGLSAAIALSDRVLNGGRKELDDYLGFLKSGGSRYPLETLSAAGVDMSKPDPIDSALRLFSKRVDELEELLK